MQFTYEVMHIALRSPLYMPLSRQKPALSGRWSHGCRCWWTLRGAEEASGRPGGAAPALRRRDVPQVVQRPHVQELLRAEQDSGPQKTEDGQTEDAPAESGGDIPLVCLRVSAARCALPPVAPALSPPACIANGRASPATCSVGVHRLSVIPRALVDRSNPPPESDDDEGDGCLEYDVYGWFKFESDADGVQRLDRQWVPLHDLEQAEGWKAAVLKLEEKLKKASSALTAGRTPARSPEA